MFKHVIVGIDGERTDRDAVALAQAVAPHASFELMCVYPYSDRPTHGDLDAWAELLRDGAVRKLHQVRFEAGIPDAEVRAEPSYNPAKAIKRRAADTHADLIVLGAAAKTGFDRVVLGDVARGVLHGAPCPVLDVARSGESARATPQVIGVAYDRSPEAVQALHVSVSLARDLGARLEIVEALDDSPNPVVWGHPVADYLDSLVGPEDERMRAMAESLEVPATGAAIRGRTHRVLRELSTRVDLMVCGSRSWGTAGRVSFGSVADRLIHGSPCPVLVVPRGAEVEADGADDAVAEAAL